jgi:hypothetical protein
VTRRAADMVDRLSRPSDHALRKCRCGTDGQKRNCNGKAGSAVHSMFAVHVRQRMRERPVPNGSGSIPAHYALRASGRQYGNLSGGRQANHVREGAQATWACMPALVRFHGRKHHLTQINASPWREEHTTILISTNDSGPHSNRLWQSQELSCNPECDGGIARLACARLREAGKDVAAVLSEAGLSMQLPRSGDQRL